MSTRSAQLIDAIEQGDPATAARLLDAEGGGFTALHEAALKGNVEVAQLLLRAGA